MRELRNSGGEVLARVERGESLTVTHNGELHPVPRQRLTREALAFRWRTTPALDLASFRADVDDALDAAL